MGEINRTVGTQQFTFHPFSQNFSTLLDFLILNPIVIFFLIHATEKAQKIAVNTNGKKLLSPYHNYGLLVLSSFMAGHAMHMYYLGFLEGDFIDAIISVSVTSVKYITHTGSVVYFWTALFMAVLFFKSIQMVSYVNFVLRLDVQDIEYNPYHEDEAGGYREILEPIVSFSYAMIGMLLIYLIFGFYDLSLGIDESNRIYSFIFYVLVIIPLFFLPYWHLHNLMIKRRKEYLLSLNQAIPIDLIAREEHFKRLSKDSKKLKKYCDDVDSINKLRTTLLTFPVWPLPVRSVFGIQVFSTLLALLPQLVKLVPQLI